MKPFSFLSWNFINTLICGVPTVSCLHSKKICVNITLHEMISKQNLASVIACPAVERSRCDLTCSVCCEQGTLSDYLCEKKNSNAELSTSEDKKFCLWLLKKPNKISHLSWINHWLWVTRVLFIIGSLVRRKGQFYVIWLLNLQSESGPRASQK